jgi:hypothetical protein
MNFFIFYITIIRLMYNHKSFNLILMNNEYY